MKVLALITFLAIGFAAEDIDSEITKKLEFFSQMEVIQNLDVAQHLETLVAEQE